MLGFRDGGFLMSYDLFGEGLNPCHVVDAAGPRVPEVVVPLDDISSVGACEDVMKQIVGGLVAGILDGVPFACHVVSSALG